MRVSEADRRTSLQLRRVRALLWGKVTEAKLHDLDRAIKSFDPNQPRVPAGNPDGGEWTGGSGGGGAGDATSDVRVAQGRRGGRGRGSDAGATPAQQMIRNAREGQAREAIRQVQEIEPGWRPRDSATSGSIQGQIERAEGQIREAEARLRELARLPPDSLIDALRRQDLDLFDDELLSHGSNTVVVSKAGGRVFYGVNSNAPAPLYSDEDSSAAKQLRTKILETSPVLKRSGNIGQMPMNALFHAETTSLLRAARANGGTLKSLDIEMHVDGRMCNNCKRTLPLVAEALGNPTVAITDDTGFVGTIRNGVWE